MAFHMECIMKYKYRHQELYKDKKIDIKSNSKKELIAKIQRKKDQIDKQTIDSQIRLDDFCTLYLETYKKSSVSASWYRDLCWIKDMLVEGISNKPVGKITPIEVQSFLNSCDYADSTMKKIYDFTKKIFRHAQINGTTDYTFDLIVPRGRPAKSRRSLTDREQLALLKVIKGTRAEAFISIMYYCGLRPSEVSALTWSDIDFDRNVLTVSRAVKRNDAIGEPKSRAGVREVPIPSNLSTVLQNTPKSSIFVCWQRNGHHTKSSVRKLWQKIKKELETELCHEIDFSLYDIRHTYCTNLERAGVPINIASRLMGHSDISLTSKIYTHASSEALEIARMHLEEYQKEKEA